LLAILFLLLGITLLYFQSHLKVITGNVAKRTCSCVFIADRSLESVNTQENSFSVFSLATAKIDTIKKFAKASIWGMATQTAIYREGLGCALTTEAISSTQLQQQQMPDLQASLANTKNLTWPMGDKLVDSLLPSFDQNKLNKAIAVAFQDPLENTRAVVVLKNGQLIGEQYADGFDKDTPILGWSMAKSITSALVGILVKEGKIDIHQPVDIPEWKNDERAKITMHNLLQMSSGLKWGENYTGLSDVTRMLSLDADMYQRAISVPAETPPDTKFYYSSGTTNIVAGLIKKQFSSLEDYWTFAHTALFDKIGMHSAVMEPDATGTFVGSSYCYATPRDWAKFGQLYLNDGVWNGERILPEGWVEYTHTAANASEKGYGAFFWLNQDGEMADVPKNTYSCQGFQGQRVFILPSQNLVVVRMGLSDVGDFDFNEFLKRILESGI